MRRTKAILFGLALILGQVLPATATILWAGGEDIDFNLIGLAAVTTTAGQFRTGYAREAITSGFNSNITTPSIYRAYTQIFSATTSLWLHAETIAAGNGTNSGQIALAAIAGDGNQALLLRGTGTAGQVKISKIDTAGTVTDLVTCSVGAWPTTALGKLDWSINYAVAGGTTLYFNDVQICTFSGDVTTNSRTTIQQYYLAYAGASGGAISWSEVIVSTTDTRDMNLFTCFPNSNGTTVAWTGSFSNVNPTAINDASSITTGSSNVVAEFNCPSLPAGSFTVPAVTSSLRIQRGASGPQNFQFVTKPNGASDQFSGSTAAGNVFSNSYQIQSTNPATAGAWSTSDINGMQQGVKSIP